MGRDVILLAHNYISVMIETMRFLDLPKRKAVAIPFRVMDTI